jgi:hypothetical protein
MLYAILDEVMQEGEPVGDEDKVHVQKCECPRSSIDQRVVMKADVGASHSRPNAVVNSIKGRLEALRRKMQTA